MMLPRRGNAISPSSSSSNNNKPPTTTLLVLIFHFFLLLPNPTHAADLEPNCENQPHPLPPLTSCLNLITTIHHESLTHPYLYYWSRHPPPAEPYCAALPRTFIDTPRPGYTYSCTITVDVLPGHEEGEGDAFRYLDIARAADAVVRACLMRERGMRPQVGWMGVGVLEEGREVGVRVGSLRRVGKARGGEGGMLELVDEAGVREVGVT